MTIINVSEFRPVAHNHFYRSVRFVFLYATTNLIAVTALLWGGVYIAALVLTGIWPH